jgi:hypothetical protein
MSSKLNNWIAIWNKVHADLYQNVAEEFADELFHKFPQFYISIKYSVIFSAIKYEKFITK